MAVQTFDLLGKFKIPAVGFGTFTATDEKELEAALDAAFEAGYRHIDTATIYANEHIIGKVLQKWFHSGKLSRKDIFITTKLPPNGVHPDRAEKFLLESLEKLQLDYVDLYLIHFPICTSASLLQSGAKPEHTDLIATWKKLEEQVDLGRAKAIGVSNFNINQVQRILDNARIKPAANQIELHIFFQQPELVNFLQQNGVLPISYSTLGNPGINKFLEKVGRPLRTNALDLLGNATVKTIAEKHDKTSGQILLKYWVQKKVAVIPKSVTPSRIKENIDLFDFSLGENDLKSLESLDLGEEGRQAIMSFSKEFLDHPEYPFPRRPL
ncbi:aldose reductase A-like isoform X3 [Sitophilus oryzae]|uniref:Aldose reductase A-like isoform X3 n=1 Tax=Sitophilus oryzae TaxID=7048 RepID=A0A6J2YAF4_SITOR|nr:aldose reductase A-like isoform X3 [Sitophilus oryzae]